MAKYRFILENSVGVAMAYSKVYNDEDAGNTLNENLASWISYGFPDCEGEDNGAGIIIPNDSIKIEYVDE